MSAEVNNARVNVMLPESLREKAERLAKKEDISLSALARKAIRRFVEQACTPAAR